MTMVHFLPQAPHMTWQTAASPFILPSAWQTMYKRCPRCGGNAPNICDEVWPDNWWEDDMLGLMYQGHIPPSRRVSPWDAYYSSYRVHYPPPATPQTPLRVDTQYPLYPQEPHMGVQAPMTPPDTPGIPRPTPSCSVIRPTTPTSPTLKYNRQGTFNAVSSFDSVHGTPSQILEFGNFSPPLKFADSFRRPKSSSENEASVAPVLLAMSRILWLLENLTIFCSLYLLSAICP